MLDAQVVAAERQLAAARAHRDAVARVPSHPAPRVKRHTLPAARDAWFAAQVRACQPDDDVTCNRVIVIK